MTTEKDIDTKKKRITGENIIPGVLLLAFFLTVCVVDSTLWRGVITAKYFYFSAIICFALPVSAYLFIRRKKIVFLIRTADIAAGLLISYTVVHRLVIGGTKDMHWWLFLLMIPLYVIIRTFSENKKTIRILTTAVLIAVLVETLWGILQLCHLLPSYHSIFPITGSLFNPAPYAGFVAVGIPLALGQLVSKNSFSKERILGGIVLLTSVIILPFTESRAAWLAALAGGATAAWVGYAANKRKGNLFPFLADRRWHVAIISILTILAITVLYGMYHMKKDSADGRWFIWKVSMSIVKEHPVVGIGTGRFAAAYGQAQADYFLSGKGTGAQVMIADYPDYAFNEYVHIAVELGLAGLSFFLIPIGLCLFPYIRPVYGNKNRLSDYYMPAFICILVFALFSYPFDVLPLLILFVTFLAVTASRTTPLRWKPAFGRHIAGWLTLLALAVTVSLRILPRKQSYQRWQETHMLFRSGDYSEALDEYLFLHEKLKYEKKFLMEYARCLSHLGQYEESNKIFREYLRIGCDPEAYNYIGNNYKAMGEYDAAEQAYIRSVCITPNRHYPEYLLMKLYCDTGKKEKAREKARLLANKPVKVNSRLISLIRQEAVRVLEAESIANK